MDIVAEIADVRAALEAGHFNVAMVGQFKRGKSTLINALIGRELLPVDVTPLTSAITIVQYGSKDKCVVKYENGHEQVVPLSELGLFVSEEGNPGNIKNIRAVIVETPVDLLEKGMRLVDTPGVGSVFEPNSETTRLFVPRIDVAIVVLGSDPPITGEELNLVRAIKTLTDRMLIVLNKSDLVTESVRSKAESFTRDVIKEQLGGDPGDIRHISALQVLKGTTDSAFGEFSAMLTKMASSSGPELARQSAHRVLTFLSERLLQNIELERKGLIDPIAELDHKIARFQASMRDINDSMLAARVRVGQEIPFNWNDWTAERELYISDKTKEIISSIEGEKQFTSIPRNRLRKEILGRARQLTRECAEKWKDTVKGHFEEFYGRRVDLAVSETNRIIGRVYEASANAFNISLSHFEIHKITIETKRDNYDFTEPVMALDISDWLIPLANAVLPGNIILRSNYHRTKKLVADWLTQNLYQVDEQHTNWLDKATRLLAEEMQQRLDGLQKEILDAVAKGRRERDAGETAIADRLKVIDNQQALLLSSLKKLRERGVCD